MSLTKARELREERAKLFAQAKADLTANPEGFTPEERTNWQQKMDRIDELKDKIDDLEADEARLSAHQDALEQRQELLNDAKPFGGEGRNVEEERDSYLETFRGWVMGTVSDSEIRRHPHLQRNRELMREIAEARVIQGQTKGTAAQGGNLVPTEMEAGIQAAMKAYGGMRSVARVINTPNGRNLDWPTSDDTSNVARIIAEATAPSTTARVPFGKVTLEAAKYQSGPIKMSMELLQDAIVPVDQFVQDAIVTRFGRATNAHFTTRSSTESVGPHGITNDSTGAVLVARGGLTAENLLSLIHSVDPAYREGPSVAWMLNDASLNTVRALRWSTASDQPFVWEPQTQPGQPDRLFGWPVVLNQDVASESTGAGNPNKWIWFGNWNHYFVRDVMGISMRRLVERYAEEGNDALLAFARFDGRRVTGSTSTALAPYKCIRSTTA